jgi:hypothetical protein
MSDTTTIEPTGKRKRERTVLTDRLCEARVAKRTKYYDRKCPGLYVSITPTGATFCCNFTDAAGRPTSRKIGVFHPESFKVADARGMVYAMKAKGGAAIGETLCRQKAQAAKHGVTVDQVITERVEWMKTEVLKRDGEMRLRIETWSNVETHLRRFISPRLGKKLANEITKSDIAKLSNDIVAGEFGVPSVANARHMRRAASAMFTWAAEAGRDYVPANPCVNLPKLDEENPGTRVLTEDEVRTLWHGLDRSDLPHDRTTRLAISFAFQHVARSRATWHHPQ